MTNQPEMDFDGKPVVCRRTRMDDLADLLIDGIYAEIRAGKDLFRRIPVIVPNRSIERYLSLRFAHRHEVTAQIEFLPLMSVFWRFTPRNPARLNIDEKTIGWRVYRILLERDSERVFPELIRWVNGDAKKLYELSRQLGSLYDKYILYRPDWINAWEDGLIPPGLEKEPAAAWQGELWRRVAGDDWKGNHFAAVYGKILRGEPDPVPGADHAGPIRIFGFSQLPPAVLRCLERFSAAGASVTLYHLVPGKTFFMEDVRREKDELKEFLARYFHEGQDPDRLRADMETLYFQHNPLVASFAMQSRVLLSGTGDWDGDTDYDYEAEERPVPEDDTVLHRLQDRIRRDIRPRGVQAPAKKAGTGCRSVQIRSCYSAFREVEAAHNFILHCLDEDPELSIKDIFIMTPSPSEYAPLVDAVFNHSHDTARLDVSVADRPQTERLPSYSTLMKALALFKGDFAASDVFGIMQDRELQAQWGLTADDCQYCLNSAMRAGIRWGWDADEHRLSGGAAFPENSWRTGFDRMLLDYAMDADPAVPYRIGGGNEIFPVPGFDGGRADLLGKFIGLTSKLHEIARSMRRRERSGVPFRDWEVMLTDAAGYLFGKDSELKILLQSVLSVWFRLLTDADAADVPLTSGIVLAYLQDKHVRPEDNTVGFMRGKITFCGLRPMRSIPADAILLLGMDHGTFPEEDDNREFDLMQQYRDAGKDGSAAGREPGDPLRRDESRQLFLDTIMAARKYLYISYIGRDNHDRKEKPPSACVDELKNYLTQEFGENSFVELQEPIHAFSTGLFRSGAVNQSYSTTLLAAAKQIADPARSREQLPLYHIQPGIRPPAPGGGEAAQEHIRRVDPDTLEGFFRNPAGTFVKNGLGAAVTVYGNASPEDSEMFEGELDWDRKKELLRMYLETPEPDRAELKRICLKRMKLNGAVPLTQTEDDWQDWTEIVELAGGIESVTAAGTEILPEEERVFEYTEADAGKSGAELRDVLSGTFRTTLILAEAKVSPTGNPDGTCVQAFPCMTDSISGSLLVEPVIRHLRANLSRKTRTRIVYFDKKKGAAAFLEADAMERTDAEQAVKRLLYLYHAGMYTPLPFFPKASCKLYQTGSMGAAESDWTGSQNSKGDVVRFGMFFGGEMPSGVLVEALAEAFFGAVVFSGGGKSGKSGKGGKA